MMIKASIAVVIVVAAIGLLLAPTIFAAGERRALAALAVQFDIVPVAVKLLEPLAKAGDAVAQNNLGVLFNRGVQGKREPIEAARLLNAAAAAGLSRAQLNLLLLRAPCDTGERDRTIGKLEDFARAGDRRAASLAIDCMGSFASGNMLVEETRQMLAMAEIATSSSDPDEELKSGWLLLKRERRLDGYGSDAAPLRQRVAQEAARYLFRAAEHGRPAAYEGISLLAADAASLLAGDAVATRAAAHTPVEWIGAAAEAGHPRSRCAVGVALATRLSADGVRASDADRKQLAGLFQTCLKDRDPRQIVLKGGREQTVGHYRLFDVWMMEEAFLIMSPQYDDYDHDVVAQEAAVRRIVSLAGQL
jgi:hypothetical protein